MRNIYYAHCGSNTHFIWANSLEEAKASYKLANLGDPDLAEWRDEGPADGTCDDC